MFDMTAPEEATDFTALDDKTLLAAEARAERAVEAIGDDAAKADLRAIRLEILARAIERSDELGYDFDMQIGFYPINPALKEEGDLCGSAGCIAGMAYTLWMESLPPKERLARLGDAWGRLGGSDEAYTSEDWDRIRNRAVNWLHLRPAECREGNTYGPELFDPEIQWSPNGVGLRTTASASPRMAAEACRRVARGERAWPVT